MSSKYSITGIPGPVQTRISLREFSTTDALSKRFNLYLKALTNLMDSLEDETNPLGWYQMAGTQSHNA